MSAPALDHLLKSVSPSFAVPTLHRAESGAGQPFESYLHKAATAPPPASPSQPSEPTETQEERPAVLEAETETAGEQAENSDDLEVDLESMRDAGKAKNEKDEESEAQPTDQVEVSIAADIQVTLAEEGESAENSRDQTSDRVRDTDEADGEHANERGRAQQADISTEDTEIGSMSQVSEDDEQQRSNRQAPTNSRGTTSDSKQQVTSKGPEVATDEKQGLSQGSGDDGSTESAPDRSGSASAGRNRSSRSADTKSERPINAVAPQSTEPNIDQNISSAARATVEVTGPSASQPGQPASGASTETARPAAISNPTATATASGTPEDNPTTTVDRARFVQRVSSAFRQAQQNDGQIQLRLSPPELGSLRIEIAVRNGVLTANLETETSEARRIVLDNLPALRDRLAQQDIRIDKFDVDVRREGHQQQGQHQESNSQDRDPQQDKHATPRQSSTPASTKHPVAVTSQLITASEGFDVRI